MQVQFRALLKGELSTINYIKVDNNFSNHHAGFVNLIGNPNVGKSTLMNQLVGEQLSITTAKAQTTRHRIKGIVDGENFQIIYSDLPGILTPAYKMQEMMMRFVTGSLKDADVILYLVECGETKYNEEIIAKLQQIETPIILVLNKIDKVNADVVETTARLWQSLLPQAEMVKISALAGAHIDVLLQKIIEKLPLCPPYFPKDQLTDRPTRFFVSEIIREKILLQYKKEVPYSVEVVVEEFKESGRVLAQNIQFETKNGDGKVNSFGSAGIMNADTKSEVYEFYNGIHIEAPERGVTIDGESLRWNGKTEQLVGQKNSPLTIKKDGVTLTGHGFSASAISESFNFASNVGGLYVDKKEEEGEAAQE